jgi:Flp pilus assembly protein TadD
MVNLARVQIARGELELASSWLDRAAAQRPEYPAIEATRGLLAFAGGNAAAAVDELAKARAAAPGDAEVLSNLAAALLLQGRARDAVELLREVHRLEPSNAVAAYNLGLAYDHSGDSARAVHYYGRYLRLAEPTAARRAGVEQRLRLIDQYRAQLPAAPRIELHSGSEVGTSGLAN